MALLLQGATIGAGFARGADRQTQRRVGAADFLCRIGRVFFVESGAGGRADYDGRHSHCRVQVSQLRLMAVVRAQIKPISVRRPALSTSYPHISYPLCLRISFVAPVVAASSDECARRLRRLRV